MGRKPGGITPGEAEDRALLAFFAGTGRFIGEDVLSDIRQNALDSTLAYYARMDELAQGIDPGAPPSASPALLLYNQMGVFPGSLPEPGGLLDQPVLLMTELQGVGEAMRIRKASQPQPESRPTGVSHDL